MIVLDAQIDTDLLTVRGIKQISNTVNRTIMLEHKDKVLPEHFKNVPQTRSGGVYKYEKRDKQYMISKARRFGHQLPLVKEGNLRKAVLASARVTATATGATLHARGSNLSPLSDKHRDEIEIVSEAERSHMAEEWGRLFVILAQFPQFRRKERKRNAAGKFIKG